MAEKRAPRRKKDPGRGNKKSDVQARRVKKSGDRGREQPELQSGSEDEEESHEVELEEAGRSESSRRDDWKEEFEGDEEATDFEDNLTYHEDSLSVMKGVTSTPLGENIPIWIVTDSGSMTQLIQRDYVRRLKIPTRALPVGEKICNL